MAQTKQFQIYPGMRVLLDNDGGVLLNVYTGSCYSLNPAAMKVWKHLASGLSTEQIIEQLRQEFAAPKEDLKADIVRFFEQLELKGILKASL